jgi:carbamoyltransferase
VAARLAAGEVVGVARGRMEFGPRALGARSILFDPRDVALARRVNEQLQRESFMPFAPLLHERHWDQAFAMARAPIARAAREMTLALPMREAFAAQAPGAVARDGTARPQVVSDQGDAWLAAVLLRFQALTGCPALINTSFNRHREPIICSAAEAIETARSVKLDALVIGAELIELSAARRVPQAAWA